MIYKKNKYISINLIVLIFILSKVCYSQNESGTRYVHPTIVGGSYMWYDTNSAMFQKQYPIIRNLPPINTGMPIDILLSYVYLDSLLKYTNRHQTDSLIKSWTSMNSNLANSLKYL